MAGRKPTLSIVKEVTGKKGRGINTAEPVYGAGIPDRPKWLKDKTAIEEWSRVSKLLESAGVLTVADGNSLAMYCYIVSQIALISGQIADNGYVAYDIKVNHDTGEEIMINPKTNPLALRLEKYIMELRAYSALFGLDPANRGKIIANPAKPAELDGKGRFFK